jgi:hypothetical protein
MAKEQISGSGYSLSPQDVNKHFWYYEEARGLCCIFQPRDAKGNLLLAWPAFTIPWRMIEKSMERRQAAVSSKKRKSKSAAER